MTQKRRQHTDAFKFLVGLSRATFYWEPAAEPTLEPGFDALA